jgi:hypothetical protein
MDATMRSPLHPASAAHWRSFAVGHLIRERLAAERLLGARHPLVGLLRQSETAFERLGCVATVQAAGVVLLVVGHRFGLWLAIAGLVVQLGLGWWVAELRARRRDLCLELIVEGCPRLSLACIEREWRRLLDARGLERLARSLEEIVEAAAWPASRVLSSPPLFDVRVVRTLASDLRQIASLLRGDGPCVRGVAAVQLLLTSPVTPLYGRQVEPLRRELGRVRYLLSLTP